MTVLLTWPALSLSPNSNKGYFSSAAGASVCLECSIAIGKEYTTVGIEATNCRYTSGACRADAFARAPPHMRAQHSVPS